MMDQDTKRLCCPDLREWERPPQLPSSVRSVGVIPVAPVWWNSIFDLNGFLWPLVFSRLFSCLQELGFSYVEMNASCTRSKNSLRDVVAESVNNTSIENFYRGDFLRFPFVNIWWDCWRVQCFSPFCKYCHLQEIPEALVTRWKSFIMVI